jgi:hypothetical protein
MFGKCSYNIIHRCVKKKTKLIVHTDKEILHQNKKRKRNRIHVIIYSISIYEK